MRRVFKIITSLFLFYSFAAGRSEERNPLVSSSLSSSIKENNKVIIIQDCERIRDCSLFPKKLTVNA